MIATFIRLGPGRYEQAPFEARSHGKKLEIYRLMVLDMYTTTPMILALSPIGMTGSLSLLGTR